MKAPTLFDSAHDQAVRDMIAQFERQLRDARTPLERAELELAIRSWRQQLEPPAPCRHTRKNQRPRR